MVLLKQGITQNKPELAKTIQSELEPELEPP